MQVSPSLRRGVGRWFHWCPACEIMHPLPDRWTFNGSENRPTFSPSFKQTFVRPGGGAVDCHYIITDGTIQFCPDSWHKRSDIVAMPAIPEPLNDFAVETQD